MTTLALLSLDPDQVRRPDAVVAGDFDGGDLLRSRRALTPPDLPDFCAVDGGLAASAEGRAGLAGLCQILVQSHSRIVVKGLLGVKYSGVISGFSQ